MSITSSKDGSTHKPPHQHSAYSLSRAYNSPPIDDLPTPASITPSLQDALIEKHQLNKEGHTIAFTNGRNVILQPSREETARDSAHAHSRSLCDYKWEHKQTYDGRILSTSGRHIAYRLFNESTGEAVRVVERETRTRHLIKEFRARIVDLAWATHAPLLAVLDAKGSVYVYSMDENHYTLNKYLNVICNEESVSGDKPRLVWCPYVADDIKLAEDDAPTHLLAVVMSSTVRLFRLNMIKQRFNLPEVELKALDSCENALMQFEARGPIKALRISPDATAIAVATTDGYVTFHVLESTNSARVAHSLRPLPNACVEDMLFLDNISKTHRDIGSDPFWKHVLFVSDSGRRLVVYSCYNWESVAKLRVETASDSSRLEVSIDPTARYIYLVDYDSSDLFCVELTPDFNNTQPYFVACAQICFSSKLVCLASCLLEERVEQDDFALDDDLATGSVDIGGVENLHEITFVAITHRQLLEVKVDVQRILDLSLDVTPAQGTPMLQAINKERSRKLSGWTSSQRIASSLGSASDLQQQQVEGSPRAVKDKLPILSPDGAPLRRSRLDGESTPRGLSGGAASSASLASVNPPAIGCSNNNNGAAPLAITSAGSQDSAMLAEMRTLTRMLGQMHEEQRKRDETIAEMSIQLEKLNKAYTDLRREQTDNLADVLEKISNEISNRDEHIEKVINRMNETLRRENKKIVEATLNDNAVSLQSTMELSNTRVVETVKAVLSTILVPSVETICRQLFHQLNENFRDGLQEFLEQVRSELEQAPIAPPDYQIRTQQTDQGNVTYLTQVIQQRRLGGASSSAAGASS